MQKNLSASASFAFFGITKYAREVAGDKFSVLPCSFIIFYFLSSTIAILIILLTVLFSDTFVDGIPSAVSYTHLTLPTKLEV